MILTQVINLETGLTIKYSTYDAIELLAKSNLALQRILDDPKNAEQIAREAVIGIKCRDLPATAPWQHTMEMLKK
jgi:hypothetical protein